MSYECDVCGPVDTPTVKGVTYALGDRHQDGEATPYELCEYHYVNG